MPYRIPSHSENFYHVYNRGNNREKIFFEDANYDYFLYRITQYFENKIDIIAFCLMPNHYHLLVEVKDTGFVEKAMQKFSNSYTKSINSKYKRIGHLFQGRYQSKIIPSNDYLLHLSRYIHLNPVRANLVLTPEEWKYSSYSHFAGKQKIEFLKPEKILKQFANNSDYEEFVREYNKADWKFVMDLLFK